MPRRHAGYGIKPQVPIEAVELERYGQNEFQEIRLVGARRNGSGPPDSACWQAEYRYSYKPEGWPAEVYPVNGRLYLKPDQETLDRVAAELKEIEEDAAAAIASFKARRAEALAPLTRIPNGKGSEIEAWLRQYEAEQEAPSDAD